jgi:hypothetical protein
MTIDVAEAPPAPAEQHTEHHNHSTFTNASLIAARLCGLCGGYVAGDALIRHQAWHDRVARVEHYVNEQTGTAEEPTLF